MKDSGCGRRRASDNSVRIPAFTRVDAAQPQVCGFGAKYYPVANSNNNITPGAPFSLRFTVAARF